MCWLSASRPAAEATWESLGAGQTDAAAAAATLLPPVTVADAAGGRPNKALSVNAIPAMRREFTRFIPQSPAHHFLDSRVRRVRCRHGRRQGTGTTARCGAPG